MESDINLFLRIWTKPREVMRSILDTDPTKYVILLAAIGGFFQNLSRAAERNKGDDLSLGAIYILALIFGSLTGIIGLYISGALIKWTGGWLGGKGTSEEIRSAVAWGTVPAITVNVILLIPLILLYGNEFYSSYAPNILSSRFLTISLFMIGAVQLITSIWSFIVGLKCLGEAQGFSAWRALGNTLLSVLVIFIPLLIIMFAVL